MGQPSLITVTNDGTVVRPGGTGIQRQFYRRVSPQGTGIYCAQDENGNVEVIGGPGSGSLIPFGNDTDAAANNIQVTIPGFTSLVDDYTFEVRNLTTNTGAVTMQIDASGSKAVVDTSGSALTSGMLTNGEIYLFAYDLTNDRYELLGLSKPVQPAWLLAGNTLSGGSPSTPNEFFGSVNNYDVVFKTNNVESMRISSSGVLSLGLGSTRNANILFNNSTNGNTITIGSGVTSATYSLVLPLAQGAAGSVLTNNGAGVLSFSLPSSTAWVLNGNTVGAEKWIGTIDAFAFPIRTNNVERGRIDSSGLWTMSGAGTTSATYVLKINNSSPTQLFAVRNDGLIEAGNAAGTMIIGLGAGYSAAVRNTIIGVNSFIASATGTENVCVGFNSLNSITSGSDNIAIGYESLQNTTNGQNDIAIGSLSLKSNIGGGSNVAIGTSALTNSPQGDYNVAIGMVAMEGANSNGSRNTAIGTEVAQNFTVGNGNVFIGNRAGKNQTAVSNLLFIDNQDRLSAGNDVTMSLIYGVFDGSVSNQQLRFNAQIVDMSALPTGNAGVASGQLYVDTAANILTNGDNIVARKV